MITVLKLSEDLENIINKKLKILKAVAATKDIDKKAQIRT
jgi:hypothetical protein